MAALQTQRPKVTTKDGQKLKYINKKEAMAAVIVLG